MRLWPKSLFGQILLTTLLGLFLTQLIGMAHIWNERSDLAAKITGYHAAERIAGIINVLDATSGPNRETLVQALSVPPISIGLDRPWEIALDQNPHETDYFIRQLNRVLDKPYPIQAITVSREAPWMRQVSPSGAAGKASENPRGRHGNSRGMHGRTREDIQHIPLNRLEKEFPVGQADRTNQLIFISDFPPFRPDRKPQLILMARVQVRLTDGQVVTFFHDLRREPIDWPFQAFLLFILMGISVAILAGWSVRYLTRPLRVLSTAAIGLGKNLDQAPLPEKGPTEVASAARAFNTMQKAIKQHVETRSQTLAALSHDLRLPITRIRLRLEKLKDAALKGKLEEDLSDIDTMIDNTLAFLRAGKNNMDDFVPINMAALIDSIADDMEAMGATIRIKGEVDRPIRGHPQALRRCLCNLIENARRYGDDHPIDLFLKDTNESFTIEICDRGPGIADEDKSRVFEPYVRLETSRAKHTGGSGLGLATAQATIHSHQGEIALKDREGGGLRVIVTLPRGVNPGSSSTRWG